MMTPSAWKSLSIAQGYYGNLWVVLILLLRDDLRQAVKQRAACSVDSSVTNEVYLAVAWMLEVLARMRLKGSAQCLQQALQVRELRRKLAQPENPLVNVLD